MFLHLSVILSEGVSTRGGCAYYGEEGVVDTSPQKYWYLVAAT